MTKNRSTCIACGGDLNEGFRLCQSCGSYQSFWRNELRYWATVVGVFSLIAATVGFSISAWPDIRKTLFWRDSVEILRFFNAESTTEVELSIANSGDGPVWIERLTYEAGGSFTWPVIVAKTVQVDEVLNTVLNPSAGSGSSSIVSPIIIPEEFRASVLNSVQECLYAEFDTNPDSSVGTEYWIPGKVKVRYVSLKTDDWYWVESDLSAIVFEYRGCEESSFDD